MAMQVLGTREVFQHHAKALGSGDLDEILSDYTEDSILITADAVLKGRTAIRAGFERFVAGIFKPGTYQLTLDKLSVEGEIVFAVWHAECSAVNVVLGTDTFLIKDSKIAVQTFAAKIEPRA